MKKRILCFTIILSMMIPLLSGCSNSRASVSKSGFYLDTIIQITLYGTEKEHYINDCFKIASDLEQKLSNTIESSEISKINANPGSYITVSEETMYLIKKAINYYSISNGSFDITIGKLSELWNFSETVNSLDDDHKADESILPVESLINSYKDHVDASAIVIDEENSSIMLNDNQAKIDLGGIAKGYIADKMKEYLEDEGITSGIIDLGGNVLTIGNKKDGSEYNIGIQKPFAPAGETITSIKVSDKSVVTSGIYERYYYIDDKIYHHILDKSTGYPVENNLYSVSIICDSSIDGDALSTTCMLLGKKDGLKLIESLDHIEAIFVENDYTVTYSSGLNKK